jgi:rubredoxin
MSCRCPSCGYVHDPIDAKAAVLDPEPVRVPVAVIPPVVQRSRCPLCGMEFDDPADYTAHRERNCAPAPEVPAGSQTEIEITTAADEPPQGA